MKNNVKIFGLALTVAMMAGCTGTGLPSATGGDLSQPGFYGTVTKNGAPVKGAKLWLKKYSGTEGSLAGGSAVAATMVETDDKGLYFIPAPAEAVSGGALFGIGYDKANAQFGGDATNAAGTTLKGEFQWFSSPAINLSTKDGKRASVSFDIGWNTEAFQPASGQAVPGPNVTFTLPVKTGATKYEVQVNKGSVAGSGEKAYSDSSTTPSLTWKGATAGNYVYQAKVFLPAGIAGISADSQAAAPWLSFTVSGAQ